MKKLEDIAREVRSLKGVDFTPLTDVQREYDVSVDTLKDKFINIYIHVLNTVDEKHSLQSYGQDAVNRTIQYVKAHYAKREKYICPEFKKHERIRG